MNKLFFKSDNRLIKINSVDLGNLIKDYLTQVKVIQKQNRELRQDLVDIKLMLNKLLIDKHLQMQVDEYFDKDEHPATEDLD